ncbi:hypothetical protein LZ575_15750 [Antarcticibacterium sp. 1MA-6-2]|uniref:hypothetical protein n=1 Tax=Antarcticibacterium sp. 1MA-6-2 TaxID=2908210 RepID=UPI001F297C95|nr:hypothetical protein [Antarcticibacterium sp. 1MA-6-2]UJH90301.1 hypothetical protein LZ575_15750 [Antarcticibacterium sp. 1MA-6-2]
MKQRICNDKPQIFLISNAPIYHYAGAFFVDEYLMKYSVLCLLVLPLALFSQKDTSRSFDAGNVQRLEIFLDEVFRINLQTSKEDKILISTHSEGEYFNYINLEVEQLQNKMLITSSFREILQSGYDKLSAHKVFSLEVKLTIPEGLEVYISSNIGSVNATGAFEALQVDLQSGGCTLKAFTGNAIINTYRGGIFVATVMQLLLPLQVRGR